MSLKNFCSDQEGGRDAYLRRAQYEINSVEKESAAEQWLISWIPFPSLSTKASLKNEERVNNIEIKFNYLLPLTLFSGSLAVSDPMNAPPNPVQEIVIVEQPLVVSTINEIYIMKGGIFFFYFMLLAFSD